MSQMSTSCPTNVNDEQLLSPGQPGSECECMGSQPGSECECMGSQPGSECECMGGQPGSECECMGGGNRAANVSAWGGGGGATGQRM